MNEQELRRQAAHYKRVASLVSDEDIAEALLELAAARPSVDFDEEPGAGPFHRAALVGPENRGDEVESVAALAGRIVCPQPVEFDLERSPTSPSTLPTRRAPFLRRTFRPNARHMSSVSAASLREISAAGQPSLALPPGDDERHEDAEKFVVADFAAG